MYEKYRVNVWMKYGISMDKVSSGSDFVKIDA
jgi:hypothetical protein